MGISASLSALASPRFSSRWGKGGGGGVAAAGVAASGGAAEPGMSGGRCEISSVHATKEACRASSCELVASDSRRLWRVAWSSEWLLARAHSR